MDITRFDARAVLPGVKGKTKAEFTFFRKVNSF
jgi:hypothetical protein